MRRGFRHLCDLEERRELLQAWEGVCSRQNKLCTERHSREMELGILRVAGNGVYGELEREASG